MRNVTITLEEDVARWARLRAAERDTSVSRLVGGMLRYDTSEPDKQRQAELWLDHLWTEGTGRVSIQVLQGLYSSLTRKLDHPMEPDEARSVVRSLLA